MSIRNSFELESIMRSNKIRVTGKRKRMLDAILSWNGVFAATELHLYYKKIFKIDLATVYRFLILLERKAIVRKTIFSKEVQYYEVNFDSNPNHPHFLCNYCDKIYCLEDFKFNDALKFLQYSENHKVKNIQLTFTGECNNCKKKEKK